MTSKYSTLLPDIDDQPDVYETPDVDLSNPSSDDDGSNENLVRSRISVKDATARFKDSAVDTSGVDFSDRLTRRKKAMYRSIVRRPPALDTDEFEILPRELELKETPIQKLRRLMYEAQELNEHVEKAQVLQREK
ncbi:Dynamitin-domain-containing protein [Dichotomocladium elegans]|nr:Dynamitin-domain-containing protein [Dichotomocladium elegans]